MATVKHAKQSGLPADEGNSAHVEPTDWYADHTITSFDHTHAATGSGSTGGGTTVEPATLNATGLLKITGGIDSTVDADQNNYNPTNLHTVSIVRFTSFTANRSVTGLDAGVTGEVKFFINNTSHTLNLPNESTSSTAANRFRCPNSATHAIRSQGSALMIYYAGRWTVIAA